MGIKCNLTEEVTVAQLVEQPPRKRKFMGSNPTQDSELFSEKRAVSCVELSEFSCIGLS